MEFEKIENSLVSVIGLSLFKHPKKFYIALLSRKVAGDVCE